MTELLVQVEQEADGGYVASGVGESIVTQGDSWGELVANVREAVGLHFDGREDRPKLIRFHVVRDEVIAV